MFNVIIKKNSDEVGSKAFKIMKDVVKSNRRPVLGLATGSSPVGLYKKMIADHIVNGTSYKRCVTFNLDEYVGLPADHAQSYYTFMHENLFSGIDVLEENIHIPNGNAKDEASACREYEDELKKYEVDIQILGIGSDGHIAFNEPGTPFESETHLMKLTEQTRKDNARFFGGDIEKVPSEAITQGLASIMRSKKIVLIATGKNKADAVYNMIHGPKTTACPASVLQNHQDVTVILDEDAAEKLGKINLLCDF